MDFAETEQQCIPHPPPSNPRCCCGKSDCAYLRHNNAALAGLEEDVQKAARLGQALLVRHETYMADAERERLRMTSSIEKLQQDKQELGTENAKYVHENRVLLDRLEQSNHAVVDADEQIESLTATLRETQQELQRLALLAARADRFEAQIAELGTDQAQLQSDLASSEENGRSAVQRCRQAERMLVGLQEQVERIENEAEEERARHVDTVRHLERRRRSGKELRTTDERDEGEAITATSESMGNKAVSHFVRDILQDNANLQLGIIEVRELLHRSNEEVEKLRNQLVLHSPLDDATTETRSPSLPQYIGAQTTHVPTKLHVHHHYYAPDIEDELAKTRHQSRHGPTGNRDPATPGFTDPSTSTQTPLRPNLHKRRSTPWSEEAALQHIPTSIPQATRISNRRSLQSINTNPFVAASVGPTSPQSTSCRTSSIFDRLDNLMDSSRPTSPDSIELGSPWFGSAHRKNPSDASWRSFPTSAAFSGRSRATSAVSNALQPTTIGVDSAKPNHDSETFSQIVANGVILEESEADLDLLNEPANLSTVETTNSMGPSYLQQLNNHTHRLGVRRAASHESILSVHGMDVHGAAQSSHQRSSSGRARNIDSSTLKKSLQAGRQGLATISATTATASRSLQRRSRDSSSLLSSFMTEHPGKPVSTGGWSWRWGKWVTASSSNLRERAGFSATVATVDNTNKSDVPLSSASTEGTIKATPRTVLAQDVHEDAGRSTIPPPPRLISTKPKVRPTPRTMSDGDAYNSAGPSTMPPPPPPVTTKPKLRPTTSDSSLNISGSGSGSRSRSGSTGGTSSPPRKLRPPGVNQKGAIWGLAPRPSQVVVDALDAEALRESLDG